MSMLELANRSLQSMFPLGEHWTYEDYAAEVAARAANSISTALAYVPTTAEANTLRTYWNGSPRTLQRASMQKAFTSAFCPAGAPPNLGWATKAK